MRWFQVQESIENRVFNLESIDYFSIEKSNESGFRVVARIRGESPFCVAVADNRKEAKDIIKGILIGRYDFDCYVNDPSARAIRYAGQREVVHEK